MKNNTTKMYKNRITATRKYNLTLLGLCVLGLISLILFNYLPMFGIM